jgi:hypothetical protein
VDESEIKPYVDDCVDYFNGLYDDIKEDISSEDAGDHEYDSFFESISNQFSALIETIKEHIEKVESEELKNAEIVSKEVSATVTDEGVTLNAKYICRENIAEPRFLLIY